MIQTDICSYGVLVTQDGLELIPDPDDINCWRLLPPDTHKYHNMRYMTKDSLEFRFPDFDALPKVPIQNRYPPLRITLEIDCDFTWNIVGAHVHIPDTLIQRIANFTVFYKTLPGYRWLVCRCVTVDGDMIQFDRDIDRGSIYWCTLHAHIVEEKMTSAVVNGQVINIEMADRMARHTLVTDYDMELCQSVMIK